MAWVTPPTFTAGTLTAAQLNQLVDGIAFLNGLSAGPIPPFSVVISTNNVAAIGTYYLRHRSNYLHVVTWNNGANRLIVTVNGTIRYNTPPAAGHVDTVLDMSGYGLTLGAFVGITVEIRADTGDEMRIHYLTELASSGSLV